MALKPQDVLAGLPDGVTPAAVLAFRADYGSSHPLWTSGARPADLSALRVPEELAARLHGWSRYLERHRDYDNGWGAGAPDAQWLSERDALPREIAALFGKSFAVRVVGGYVHSARPARSDEAAAALARLVDVYEDESPGEIELDGTSFAFIAGHEPHPG